MRDLKSNNAEKKYLEGLNRKIDRMEVRQIKSELGAAMFVVPAQMILKLGIASVALAGSVLLMKNALDLLTFFLFLLVVSRVYEPLSGAMQNLAAMNSLQINIDRMNEIEGYAEQSGEKRFAPRATTSALKTSASHTMRERPFWTAYRSPQSRGKSPP